MKRSNSSEIVENPFIKHQNKSWRVEAPSSFTSRISPPRARQKKVIDDVSGTAPTTAAVEAGRIDVGDPIAFFSAKLLDATQPATPGVPRLSHEEWLDIYHRNQHTNGRHFVIHQHDHPVAGTHYDLRLQCNATSSISFAIMYGLPGDPNSRRLNRNAAETRVHNLWNHLIETASYSTGTMLIWDTGEYSVLPYRKGPSQSDSESSEMEVYSGAGGNTAPTDSEKLHQAFAQRKIRLRLHGTRLPRNYTLSMRGSKDDFASEQPEKPARKRRRKDPKALSRRPLETSSSEDSGADVKPRRNLVESLLRTASPPGNKKASNDNNIHAASDDEETETVRLTNAYMGATNNIGSIHQRKWYLSMDRQRSGFVGVRRQGSKGGKMWTRKRAADGTLEGFEKFWVMGRDVERSVVTGRLAKDILKDEGVDKYIPRGLWRPVTE